VEWAHDHRSKINPFRDGLRMGLDVLQIRWNALMGRYARPYAPLLDTVASQPSNPVELTK
jgi:hypothetical protein